MEFTPHVKTIIEAAGPAFNTASNNAKRNNAAYCRIFTSTPGDLDTGPGQEALQIIEKTAKWTEQFYDWDKDRIEDYIAKNSGNGIVYIEYQYQQLGDDEEWFRKTCQTLLNNPAKIKREIFLQRMRGSSDSPFDEEELAALQEFKKKPIEEIYIQKMFRLDVYEQLRRDKPYFVGMDCSGGLGEDNTAITVVDPFSLKPVAEFKSPYIGNTDAIKFMHILVRKYIPKAIVAIERNAMGGAIIEALLHTDIRGNIYFDSSKDYINDHVDDRLDAKGFLQRQAARRKLYGVWTGKDSRSIMLSILEAHMKEHKDKFVTESIIDNILSLVRKKNGRIEHADGFHDDSLFSYLIAMYVYYHGKNLHRFGFVKGQLPDEEDQNKGLSYEELVEELPEVDRQMFTPAGTQTVQDHYMRMMKEAEIARREMAQIDDLLRPINQAENMDRYEGEGEGSIALDFFDMLND